jgi:sarcosine oxidase gamma subunit
MNNDHACQMEIHDQDRVLEFAAYHWPATGCDAAAWPTAAGGIVRDATGRTGVLHFAPGRWLLPNPSYETEHWVDSAARAGLGMKSDVTGKWARFSITGPGAARLLASAIGLAAILDGRDCAAVTLFDCPAVIARSGSSFELWVQSSYSLAFLATAGRFRALLQSAHELQPTGG